MKRGVIALVLVVAGCTPWTLGARDAAERLARADAFLARDNYVAAIAAYDELVWRHPDSEAATRARMMRTMAASVLQARAAVAKVEGEVNAARAEVARLVRELAARDGELERTRQELHGARQELAARQAELAKLTAETDRLRNVMDDLKRLDLHLERRR